MIFETGDKIQLNVFPDIHYVQAASASQPMLCDVFLQENFTQDMQPHYIYSPREMTRWVRGIHEALKPLESLSVEGLVRIWAHEALRLFQDRSAGIWNEFMRILFVID